MNRIKQLNTWGEILRMAIGLAVLGTVILANASVVSRHLKVSLPAAEELLRYVFVWIIMICTAIEFKNNKLISITLLEELLEKKGYVGGTKWLRIINTLFGVFFAGFCAFYSAKITMLNSASNKLSPVMEIPMALVSLGMAVGSVLWFIVALMRLVNLIKAK